MWFCQFSLLSIWTTKYSIFDIKGMGLLKSVRRYKLINFLFVNSIVSALIRLKIVSEKHQKRRSVSPVTRYQFNILYNIEDELFKSDCAVQLTAPSWPEPLSCNKRWSATTLPTVPSLVSASAAPVTVSEWLELFHSGLETQVME